MEDEESGAELQIVSASFADPHLLIIRDDASAVVFSADDSGELEEVDRGEDFQTTKWLSGSIFKSDVTKDQALVFMLSPEGALKVWSILLPKLQ